MSGVQSFINQRQEGQQDSPRQAAASLFKVPVPSTKLAKPESRLAKSRSGYSLPTGQPSGEQDSRLHGASSIQTLNDHRDAFDTDAESLEDTTIMSFGHDTRNGALLRNSLTQAQGNGFNLRPFTPYGNGHEQRPSAQSLDQPETEDLVIDGEAESYEESGDEEDDEEGEDGEEGEEEDDGEVPTTVEDQIRRYCEATPRSRQLMFQNIMSPSMRNLALRKAQISMQKPVNSLPSRAHSRGSSAADSEAYQIRSEHHRVQSPVQHSQPRTFQNGQLNFEKRSVTATQPAAPNGGQPDAAGDANSTLAVNGRGDKMSPLDVHKTTISDESSGGLADNGAQIHISGDTSTPMPNADHFPHFSSQQDEGVDELNDRVSIASFEDTKTRKHARDLDYSLGQLSDMTFDQLQSEAFDHDPRATKPALPEDIAHGTLSQKLDYMLNLKDKESKTVQQRAIFASLPIEQHEDCGDLIIEKCTGIVAKFKDARRQRRKVAQQFEDEVAEREERVRGKMSAVEKDLGRLKRGGEEVVRGKSALA